MKHIERRGRPSQKTPVKKWYIHKNLKILFGITT